MTATASASPTHPRLASDIFRSYTALAIGAVPLTAMVLAPFVLPLIGAARFADYLYLSTQVTTTFGGSDVEVRTARLRGAVSLHSLVAFGYNAFVVALLVSVLLSTVG